MPTDAVPARDGIRADGRSRWTPRVLLALVLVLNALYLVGDRTWWGEFVAVWPPVGWFVLLAPAALRTRSVVSGLLLFVLLALHGEWPRMPRSSASPAARLTVVSWNVAGDPRAWEILRERRPDLVLIQEEAGGPSPAWPGMTWAGSFDPGTLSRFPLTVRPTRKVGPWVEPLVTLVELPRGTVVVVNVRLVLPSVVTWAASGF